MILYVLKKRHFSTHKNYINGGNKMNIENSSAVEAVELTAGMDNLDLNTKRVKPNLRLIDTTKAKKKGKIVHREIGLVERIFKRTLDIIGGIVGVILLIPITIGVMIANKIAHDEGPVFFIQKRILRKGISPH